MIDAAGVADKATYAEPHQLSVGIDTIIVNGQIARQDGEFTADTRRGSSGSSAERRDTREWSASRRTSAKPGLTFPPVFPAS